MLLPEVILALVYLSRMNFRIFYAGIFGDSKDEESAATLGNRSDKERCLMPKRTSKIS